MQFSKYKSDYRAIFKLGSPILVAQLGVIVVGFADSIMVGRYSTDALAGAAFVNNVFNIAVLFCIGFGYGLTPLVGALFSQGKKQSIGRLLATALGLNLIAALVMTGCMLVLYLNIHRLGQPEHLLPVLRPYFITYLCGIVPIALFNTLTQWSYGVKNTKLPMWIVLASNLINIVGNYALIFGNLGFSEMGLTGAGLSTLTARWFTVVAMSAVFLLSPRAAEYRRGLFGRGTQADHTPTVRPLLKTSFPVAIQMTIETGAFSVAAIMCGWIGAVELASYQVLMTIGSLGFLIYYSFGAGVSVLVANEAGRCDRMAMRRVGWAGIHVLLVLAVISSTIFTLAGRGLIGLFTEDPAVLTVALTLLVPMILYQLMDASQICFANALRGTANVAPMLWISPVAYIVVGIPAAYIAGFPFGGGVLGIFYSFSLPLGVAAVLFFLTFMRTTRPTVARP